MNVDLTVAQLLALFIVRLPMMKRPATEATRARDKSPPHTHAVGSAPSWGVGMLKLRGIYPPES